MKISGTNYLETLNETLRIFVEKVPATDVYRRELQEVADRLTKPSESASNIVETLLALPADEYNILFQHQEPRLVNLTALLNPAFFNLRTAIQSGDQRAKGRLAALHQLLMKHTDRLAMELHNQLIIASKETELPLPDQFIEIYQQRLQEKMANSDFVSMAEEEGIPSPDTMIESIMTEAPEGADYTDLHYMFMEGMGAGLSSDIAGMMTLCFLSSSREEAHALAVLNLLQEDKRLREAMHFAFAQGYAKVSFSALNLSRLYQALYWLPKDERQRLAKDLKLDLSQPPQKIKPAGHLIKCYAGICDGSGCFSVMALLKTAFGYRNVAFLCKEGVGIKDPCMMPPTTTEEDALSGLEELVDNAGLHVLVEEINPETLVNLLQDFLVTAHDAGRAGLGDMLALAEIVSDDYWLPKPFTTEEVEIALQPYAVKSQAHSLKRSKEWLDPFSSMKLQTWFVANEALHQLTSRAVREKMDNIELINTIIENILLPEREQWQLRFMRCAMILHGAINRSQYKRDLGDWLVLINASENDDTFGTLPIISEIAQLSSYTSKMRNEQNGPALEIV